MTSNSQLNINLNLQNPIKNTKTLNNINNVNNINNELKVQCQSTFDKVEIKPEPTSPNPFSKTFKFVNTLVPLSESNTILTNPNQEIILKPAKNPKKISQKKLIKSQIKMEQLKMS